MSEQQEKIIIGITQGDFNGIGYEVIVKALANRDFMELYTPVIFGNAKIAASTASDINAEDFKFTEIKSLKDIRDGVVNILNVGHKDAVPTPGHPSKEGGEGAVAALEAASKALDAGDIDLLVTAPFDKKSVQGENFDFPGHTEYLESRFVVEGGKALMVMADSEMRVSFVTMHIPLKDVAPAITKEVVMDKIADFNRTLKMDFGCERPKIAVLSLNPHCGDGGVIGNEEETVILPAIQESRDKGILAFGPIAADGLFGSGAYRAYDGILAMYHDQGMIPFKALACGGGVNFTAGLNIIRTSPAHGTAYDKAGKGVADESSMRNAIYMAVDIARRRADYLDASENPLVIREVKPRESKRKPFPPIGGETPEPNAESAVAETEE